MEIISNYTKQRLRLYPYEFTADKNKDIKDYALALVEAKAAVAAAEQKLAEITRRVMNMPAVMVCQTCGSRSFTVESIYISRSYRGDFCAICADNIS